MFNKKLSILLVLILILSPIILNIILVKAETIPGLPAGFDPSQIELTKKTLETKWEYLGKEWRTMLLSNKAVNATDKVFIQIDNFHVGSFLLSPFRVLFGTYYYFSLTFLVIILIWFVLERLSWKLFSVITLPMITSDATKVLKNWQAHLAAICVAVILANVGVIYYLAKFMGWLVFGGEKDTLRSIIMFVVEIIVIITIFKVIGKLSSSIKKKKRMERDEKRDNDVKLTKQELKKMKKEREEEKAEGEGVDEETKKKSKWANIFADEMSKEEGEGEFESDDFTEPDFK